MQLAVEDLGDQMRRHLEQVVVGCRPPLAVGVGHVVEDNTLVDQSIRRPNRGHETSRTGTVRRPGPNRCGVIAFIRAGFDATATAVKVGDPKRGQTLFEGKGACATCHRVNGRGPRLTTDLSDIGAIRTPGSLQRSLLDPAGSLLPANRMVDAVMKDGRRVRGRRLNEDTHTVQLIDEQERIVSLTKTDLRSYDVRKDSAMPSYAKMLAPDEVSDLVAYLLSLKGVLP